MIDLYAINVDGTQLQLIVKQGSLSASSWPSPFSPNSRKVLFNSCFDECFTLLVFDLDEGKATLLHDQASRGAWSPDGQHIAFTDVYNPHLFVAKADGTERVDLLEMITPPEGVRTLSKIDYRIYLDPIS